FADVFTSVSLLSFAAFESNEQPHPLRGASYFHPCRSMRCNRFRSNEDRTDDYQFTAVPPALRVKTISSLTARIAPNQTLWPPVSWAPAHYRLCRCNHKAGAWKMHANLADLTITASDHDLMDVRGDQFTDNRVASSIVRRDGNGLARFPTDGILR